MRKVRDALDSDGFEHVKIVVSGGFTIDKIREFEEKGVPVDAYGVGSSLIRGSNDFTADIVLTDGRPSAKVGRAYKPNPRLELVDVTVLWDVDTQVDFMLPDGKLYVPRRGGDRACDGAARRGCARRRDRPRRIRRRPRADRRRRSRTSPTSGRRIRRIACAARAARARSRRRSSEDPVPITLERLPERYLAGREFLLLKKNFDVFTNPNTDRLLDWLDPDEIVVFGVATDVCDDAAIRGFPRAGPQGPLRRGRRPRPGRGPRRRLHGLLA